MKNRSLDYSLDLGIFITNPESEIPPEYDVHCKELVRVNNDKNILNWNSDWCIVRVKKNSTCSRKCPVADAIRRNRLQKDGK